MTAEYIKFDIYEPQRTPSPYECLKLTQETTIQADGVYRRLVGLRTKQGFAFPSKKALLKITGLKKWETLEKYLLELRDKGFLLISAHNYINKNGLKRTKWKFHFPLAMKERLFHKNYEKPPQRTPKNGDQLKDKEINKLINKNNSTDQGFPQTKPQDEENKNSAVFLLEDQGKTKEELEEKSEKETQLILEKQNKPHKLKSDIEQLRNKFGTPLLLIALVAANESNITILNPGGWLRKHLDNFHWLDDFIEKKNLEFLEKKRIINKRIQAKKEKEIEITKQKQNELENQAIKGIIDKIPPGELQEIREKIKEKMFKEKAFSTSDFFVDVNLRLWVKENYLEGKDVKVPEGR